MNKGVMSNGKNKLLNEKGRLLNPAHDNFVNKLKSLYQEFEFLFI